MSSTEQVRKYYNDWTDRYLSVYGDVIQAFRPKKTTDLLDYIIKSSGIKSGMSILDAGCGVCGPAIFMAKRKKLQIDAITISEEQGTVANAKIDKERLKKFIQVKVGDYHCLSQYYNASSFDAVFFLESLGHAENPGLVLEQSYQVLTNGGFVYIKDFFKKHHGNTYKNARISKVIENINHSYSYNTLELESLLFAAREIGFEIQFIKKFDFKDDISIRFDFESKFGIDIFGNEKEFHPAEWLEIKLVKSVD